MTPDALLQEAIDDMRKTRIKFLPVVERKGTNKLIGFLDQRVMDKVIATELLQRKKAAIA